MATSDRSAPIRLSESVQTALRHGEPVVALESNVVAHGLPRPLNLDSALKVEAVVRSMGAVPATTAILDGEIVVGLSDDELARVADHETIEKTSSRDIGHCLARGADGATSIAATIAIADLVGITVVASAGLGGVHRGVDETMDVSADLMQVANSRVLLVCAGAKPILDLPKTLEFLETQCVPVIGYRCDDFPAFFCTSSGRRCPVRIDDPAVLARAALLHWSAGMTGSVVAAHPIPQAHALDEHVVETAIDEALRAAERDGVSGAAITKHVMTAVNQATGGRSATANAVVLESTASVAATIAVEYAALTKEAVA